MTILHLCNHFAFADFPTYKASIRASGIILSFQRMWLFLNLVSMTEVVAFPKGRIPIIMRHPRPQGCLIPNPLFLETSLPFLPTKGTCGGISSKSGKDSQAIRWSFVWKMPLFVFHVTFSSSQIYTEPDFINLRFHYKIFCFACHSWGLANGTKQLWVRVWKWNPQTKWIQWCLMTSSLDPSARNNPWLFSYK